MFRKAFPTLIAKPDILVDLMNVQYNILAGIQNPDLVVYRTGDFHSPLNCCCQCRQPFREQILHCNWKLPTGNEILQLQAISSVRLYAINSRFPNFYPKPTAHSCRIHCMPSRWQCPSRPVERLWQPWIFVKSLDRVVTVS